MDLRLIRLTILLQWHWGREANQAIYNYKDLKFPILTAWPLLTTNTTVGLLVADQCIGLWLFLLANNKQLEHSWQWIHLVVSDREQLIFVYFLIFTSSWCDYVCYCSQVETNWCLARYYKLLWISFFMKGYSVCFSVVHDHTDNSNTMVFSNSSKQSLQANKISSVYLATAIIHPQ